MGAIRAGAITMLVGLLLLAPAASASFPGRNGVFAVSVPCTPTGFDDHIQIVGKRGALKHTLTPCGIPATGPDFAPDGQTLVYASAPVRPGEPPAAVFSNLDGTEVRRLPVPGGLSRPSFSSTGGRIVFGHGSSTDIVSARVDGRGSRTLLSGMGLIDPRWSPAGGRIAIISCCRDGDGLRLADTRAGELGPAIARSAFDPDWSPGGNRLVYADRRGIHVVRADGRWRRSVYLHGDATSFSPVWSPDGRWIAWVRVDIRSAGGGGSRGVYSLWRVRRDGSAPERLRTLGSLTFDAENEGYDDTVPEIAWQPRPRR
jgi:Tol biopolymer transport system component